MTSGVMIYFIKNLRLNNVSFQRNCYRNKLMNEYDTERKNLAKIP